MAKDPKERGLGRGLDSLFGAGSSPSKSEKKSSDARKGDDENLIVQIGINDIKPNSDQPRNYFDEEKLEELADSIKVHGILQPILVRPSGVGYEIVAGERRFRAARKAGLKKVPCIVRELSDEENMLVAIIENMQREDLDPIEEAEGLNQMIKVYGFTQDAVSRNVGKSRPYIANSIRLLGLSPEIRTMISDGKLSAGHGRALLSVKDLKKREALARKIEREGLSVREAEALATEKPKQDKPKTAKPKDRDIVSVEEELQKIFGTKVSIKGNGKKGSLELEYYSLEELNRLIDILRTLG